MTEPTSIRNMHWRHSLYIHFNEVAANSPYYMVKGYCYEMNDEAFIRKRNWNIFNLIPLFIELYTFSNNSNNTNSNTFYNVLRQLSVTYHILPLML